MDVLFANNLNELGNYTAQNTANVFVKASGKTISEIDIVDNALCIEFVGGYKIRIWDKGRNCCEYRYMSTDDDLGYFIGSTLLDAETSEASKSTEFGESNDSAFLKVKTSRGWFTIVNHNDHNGYYGGFDMVAEEEY